MHTIPIPKTEEIRGECIAPRPTLLIQKNSESDTTPSRVCFERGHGSREQMKEATFVGLTNYTDEKVLYGYHISIPEQP